LTYIPNLQLVEALKLPSETKTDGSRFYTTPNGKRYPSITTVLSALNPAWLGEWKERVGEAEAKRISGYATRRGNLIHKIFEEFLLKGSVDLKRLMPDVRQMARQTLPLLEQINRVVGIELPLYSHQLEIAGTTDCIGEWNGVLSVIDFKNSKHMKTAADIPQYFAQCAGYAQMFEECYSIPIKQVVVVIAVEDFPGVAYVERAEDHRAFLKNAIDSYWTKNEKAKEPMGMGETCGN